MRRLVERSRLPIRHILLFGLLPSPLKRWIYRLRGYTIGSGVRFGLGSVVVGDDVVIEDGVKIGFLTLVRGRRIRLGRYVRIGATTIIDTEQIEIGEDARINEQVFIGGLTTPSSRITIGKRAIVMQMSFLNPTLPIEIGNDTGIGGHCLLFTHGSWLSEIDGFPVTFAPIKLGDRVWLPWRVFVMPGVTIGDEVVIGANSLVNRDLPSNSLAAGSPAKVLRTEFPPPLAEEDRQSIVARIFDEFEEYLRYFDMKTVREPTSRGWRIIVKRNESPHTLEYSRAGAVEAGVDLAVVDESGVPSNGSGAAMTVDLRRKTRRGTSPLGEEFAAFVSRYGVRFDRLD